MPNGIIDHLKDVRNGLLRLHKKLLDSERGAYERDVARIESTGQYLDLVLNDPWFAWLHQLSRFIVTIDEALDRHKKEPLTDAEVARLISDSRALVSPAEDGEVFARSYFDAMQRDPDVVLAHRDMMRVFEEMAPPA